MNYFLGFFLNDQSRKEVVHKLGKVSRVFSDMGIPVRWIKPSDYHIKIQNLYGFMNPLKRVYISCKLKKLFQEPISISLGNVKLGTTRSLKGLVYIEIEKGGGLLRKLRYNMIKGLKLKDNTQFIPHIAIGRINKDLGSQEISNILKDIDNIARKENMQNKNPIDINEINLVKVEKGNYEILKKFRACSCA
jgi:2'-5' RNA ligase